MAGSLLAAEPEPETFRLEAPQARAANLRQQVGLVAYPPLWRVPLRLATSRFLESLEAALSPARACLLDRQFLRHLHPERGRWMTLWAADPERVTFRLRAPRPWPVRAAWQAAKLPPVIFRQGERLASLVWVLLKVAVSLRLAAPPVRRALVLRQAAVMLLAEAVSCRDRDVQRGPRRGAS